MSQDQFEKLFIDKGIVTVEDMKDYSPQQVFDAVVGILQKLVVMGSKDQTIRRKAREITKGVLPHDDWGEVTTIIKWIQDNVKYHYDGFNIEQFQLPTKTLSEMAGDCDCLAVLAASLLRSIGHQAGVVLVNTGGRDDVDHAMSILTFRKDIVLQWGVKGKDGKVESITKEFASGLPDELKIPLKTIKGSSTDHYNWILAEVTEKKPVGWTPENITYAIVILPEIVTRIDIVPNASENMKI